MAVIVGELGVAGERVHPVVDLAQELDDRPTGRAAPRASGLRSSTSWTSSAVG